MKWKIAALAALAIGSGSFLSLQNNHNEPLRQPLIKDGKYYYSEHDTHDHIAQVRKYLPKKIFNLVVTLPAKIVTKVFSLFGSKIGKKEVNQNEEPLKVEIKEPIQTVPPVMSDKPIITWIGHSSFLIQTNDFNIITDPIFGDVKAGPISIHKRVSKPGIKMKDLPPIDAVLISHDHADHTDPKALKYIAKKYPQAIACVAKGNKKLMQSFGFKKIREKTWWDSFILEKDNKTITLTCLPAKHWSQGLSLFSYRKSLWCSWMINTNNHNIYFAGDSGLEDHFAQIARQFKYIDVAILGIGPTFKEDEGNHQGHDHTDAREAVDAFITLKAKKFIPMHWGTFSKETYKYARPANVLHAYWKEKKYQLLGKRLLFPQIGAQCAYEL